MILPKITQPELYSGLYVFDFGQWTAVGYTAEEVAILLESEDYREGKVYKIQRVTPDGHMELRGISCSRFQLECGMFFYRNDLDLSRADFAELAEVTEQVSPPSRAILYLAERETDGEARFVTALIYPAECDEEMSRWLTDRRFDGGDLVEGGISHVSNFRHGVKTILERKQLWSQSAIPSRSAEEIRASVRRAVQR